MIDADDPAFVPFATARLTIRRLAAADAAAMAAYRNDPDVARHQDWAMPYPPERAEANVAAAAARSGPVPGEWWTMAVARDGELAGDVAVHLDPTGAVATIGYTLARAHHGAGLGAEAVGAVVDRLFARTRIHRVEATADPLNLPSIRLLEGLGFRPEGVARRAVEIRGEWVDDARFGLLREEHEAWAARPLTPPDAVRLVEVTAANARAVRDLTTFGWQVRLVGANVASLADAQVPPLFEGAPLVPWYRAVEADGELVGFVMMAEPSPTLPHPYLWRLMIDRRHQRRGIGHRVLQLVVEQARSWGGTLLEVSWVPGFGSPAPFYLARGFVPTGEMEGDEVVAALSL